MATYTINPTTDWYQVEVAEPGGKRRTTDAFRTEGEAKAWIAEQERDARQEDGFRRKWPRYLWDDD